MGDGVRVQPDRRDSAESSIDAHAWVLEMKDSTDPHGHTARAVQRTETSWDVEYFRDGELVSDGGIGTPPPNVPPAATLKYTLQVLRREADREGSS